MTLWDASFEYLGERIQISPRDLTSTQLERSRHLHFICSPERANAIVDEVYEVDGWRPLMIYEPIPDKCVPEELPALMRVLEHIGVISPNAEEALAILSIPLPVTKAKVQAAASALLKRCPVVVIRCGELGAFIQGTGQVKDGCWIAAFWDIDSVGRVVDVTGAGNSFLGGLSAGLHLTDGNLYEAALYATVSASFMIEQYGLPAISGACDKCHPDVAFFNGDSPHQRLRNLRMSLQSRTAYT